MTINELPVFTALRLWEAGVSGSFDDPVWIGETYRAYLILPEGNVIEGHFCAVDFEKRTACFVPRDPNFLSSIKLGTPCPRLDGYWGEQASLVLDPSRSWISREFKPRDAIRYQGPGVYILGEMSGNLPEQATVVPGGWDHEHCAICSEKIYQPGNPIGMFSEPNIWICLECYRDFVLRRSLDFMVSNEG